MTHLPYYTFGRAGEAFQAAVGRGGWIFPFDWGTWLQTAEGRALTSDREALAAATPLQLARLLTAIVRSDRFTEGSIAGEAMLSMFTQSRWTFNEGPPGEAMMRDMLIKYAERTGKPVNMKDGRAVGVPPEVQAAFVKDMMSFLRGASAKLWAAGITEEVWKGGIADDVRAAELAAEEAAGAADPQFDNPGLAFADNHSFFHSVPFSR